MEISDIVGGCLHNETSEPALLTAAPSTWNWQASGGALTTWNRLKFGRPGTTFAVAGSENPGGGARSTVVGIICPLVEIELTVLPKTGGS